MEIIQSIFVQLGVDYTLAIQFVVLILVVFATNIFFFNHLKGVLDLRDENTSQLEKLIEKKSLEMLELDEKFKVQIDEAYLSAQKLLDAKKNEALNKEAAFYAEKEREVNAFIDEERKKMESEINAQKKELFGKTNDLVGLLVKKFVD
ncbi:MAG: hypothetical protein U0T83_05155 [Bacteriovoracaceae bacterium]